MKKYVANVRVRKQDRNGNTYHDVELILVETGETVDSVEKRYGYGTHYKQTTADMIGKLEGVKYDWPYDVDDVVIYCVHNY